MGEGLGRTLSQARLLNAGGCLPRRFGVMRGGKCMDTARTTRLSPQAARTSPQRGALSRTWQGAAQPVAVSDLAAVVLYGCVDPACRVDVRTACTVALSREALNVRTRACLFDRCSCNCLGRTGSPRAHGLFWVCILHPLFEHGCIESTVAPSGFRYSIYERLCLQHIFFS